MSERKRDDRIDWLAARRAMVFANANQAVAVTVNDGIGETQRRLLGKRHRRRSRLTLSVKALIGEVGKVSPPLGLVVTATGGTASAPFITLTIPLPEPR